MQRRSDVTRHTSGQSAQKPTNLGRKKPNRRKFRRFLFLSFLFLLLGGGAYSAAVYWQVDEALDTITQNDPYKTDSMRIDPTYHSDKPLSIVILGRDTRKETGSLNTDVMMVVVADPVTKKVTMLSLPRDTRVKIPDYRGYHKINSVYANGEMERRQAEANGGVALENGITLTKRTLESVLGITINHYIEIDFDGFKAVVDELGGVELNVDRRMVYDDPTDGTHIDLQPGPQLLNGDQALDYVRHRHDNRGTKYYSSDFDRNRRQQEVIKAVMDKMTSFEGAAKIFEVIEVGSQHIHTDMSKEIIKGLAFDFKGTRSENLTAIENEAYWNPRVSYTLIPADKKDELRSALQSAMKLTNEMIATIDLNDSPFSSYSASDDDNNNSSTPRRTKPTVKEKPTPVITEPIEQESPVTETPDQNQPGQEPPKRNDSGSSEQAPPPDIPVLDAPPPDPATLPPPDIPAEGGTSSVPAT